MKTQPEREHAEALAIRGLAFLAADTERLDRFLALTGLAPGEVRAASERPGFLAGVLQHIMEDDRIALAFATEQSLTANELDAAARALGNTRWEREDP
jgi:hypothetical protein